LEEEEELLLHDRNSKMARLGGLALVVVAP